VNAGRKGFGTGRRRWIVAVALLFCVAAGLVVRNQMKVHRGRQQRAADMMRRHPALPQEPALVQPRRELFELLRPVALGNCRLERFGERNDGGYLMCANLLDAVQAGYSYGISGYDKWGCDISTRAGVTVHQYDCFDGTRPWCWRGKTVFHDECVGGATQTIAGRPFDTIASQLARNGDSGKRIVLKIDVEAAEWDTFLAVPDDVFKRIDQMAVEFHWEETPDGRWNAPDRYLRVVRRLKQFFEVAHIHFNNASCVGDLVPFPSSAFEALFVSRRLAVVDPAGTAGGVHEFDAQNNPSLPDCLPK
jgi:hypothetical protein